MRVLVTGAGGFVGQHLCRHLAERGDEVLPLAGPNDGAAAAVDITDGKAVRAALEGARPDAVLHLAGVSSVAASLKDPAGAFAVNVLGAVNLLAAVKDVAPAAKVVLVGSSEMYGAVEPGTRAAEDAPLRPLSPYASSKLAAEIAGFQFQRGAGLHVVSARPFNHLGAGQRQSFVVPSFAAQLAAVRRGRAEPVLRVGNLEAVRDFSHVDDVVEAYGLLLHEGVAGEAYNICSGQGRSIRGLLERMIELSGVQVRVEVDPARLRPSDLPALVGDPSKALRLGWRPSRSVDDALRDALQWAETQS